MASQKNPEERSMTGERQPGHLPAQPTGDEVFESRPRATGEEQTKMTDEETNMTDEERGQLEELERAAVEAFEQLGMAAERLADRAADAYRNGRVLVKENPGSTLLTSFVVGVVVGILMSGE